MHDISLILLITFGLSSALVIGAMTHRLGLSPIVGYLLAGIVVGPHTPGFVADPNIASQLAEIGVILLMFGVGLHFKIEDLGRVRRVAIPGAVVQIAAATLFSLAIALLCGFTFANGLVLGLAVSVASTVVLIRVLEDNKVLHTTQGHIAVGWLIVEDLFTVLVLVLLPALQEALAAGDVYSVLRSLCLTLLKIASLVGIVLIGGRKLLPRLLNSVARMRSRELFTLAVLVTALGIAAGSAILFGVSMALGAFLAGMVVGQSDVSHQAASDALPMRDAFAVLFFVSVGMLFNPAVLVEQWVLILGLLSVILIGKPLVAMLLVLLLGYPIRTALTVSVALAQIGEFSFILGEVARSLGFLSTSGSGVLVTCAILSISVNSLFFRAIPSIEKWLSSSAFLEPLLRYQSENPIREEIPYQNDTPARAIVVGYGPVGQTLARLLTDFQIPYVVIDLNVDTVRRLRASGIQAIYGEASHIDILQSSGLDQAEYLCITTPDQMVRAAIIETALTARPDLKIIVRAQYIGERESLSRVGISAVAYEEAEVAVALAEMLLQELEVSDLELLKRSALVRAELAVER